MEAPKSLDSLFKEKLFRIPDYQRGYAWQREQLKDFWEDLLNLSDTRSHYTGVLTLKEIPADEIAETEKEYWLVEDHSYHLYHIVDGQQRLTTFIIFLQAFVDFVKSLPDNQGKTDDDIYITESLSVTAVIHKYLYKTKPTGDQFRTYKFGYTEDNPSYTYLRYRILNEDAAGRVQETFYTLNLSYAKHYFLEQLGALYGEAGLSGLRDIYKKLTKRFLFNEYIIQEEFDVFVAFETMNNRGKKLSDLELLKNRLIYLTTIYGNDELDPAERKNLRETINDAWKEVYSQLGRNKLRPLNDDDFLKAHWTMYFKYSRQTGCDYINFLLNEQFTPQKVHKKVERDVAWDVPQEQRAESEVDDNENGNGDGAEEERYDEGGAGETTVVLSAQLQPTEIRDFVKSLKESVVYWFNSFYPEMAEGMSTDERQWLERLNRIGISYFRPLVMAILKNEPSTTARIDIFKSIERFIFIAFRLMGARTNYRSSEFSNAARAIDRDKANVAAVKSQINEAMAFALNADGTLRAADFDNVLDKLFKSGGGYYDWSGLKYFLYEYELSLLEESRQEKRDWADLLKTPKDKISIEHIYPQTETEEWAEAFCEIGLENRRHYTGTLGNLLLLSAAINSSLQNDNFVEKKRPKFNAAGEKVRNGYSDGSHSEIEVSRQNAWGPQEIHDRGMRLLGFMAKRWDFKFKNDSERHNLLFLNFEDSDEPEQVAGEEDKAAASRPNTISKRDSKDIARITQSAIRLLMHRTGIADAFRPKLPEVEVSQFLASHLRVRDAATHIWKVNGPQKRLSQYISPGYAAGLLYLMAASASDSESYYGAEQRNEGVLDWSLWDKACEFFTAIACGNLEMQAVRMALDKGNRGGDLSGGERWAILIKAWSCFAAGKGITEADIGLKYDANEYGGVVLSECRIIGGIDRGEPPDE